VAAHEEVVPLHELLAACAAARDLLRGEHGVSRVIARPFVGPPGHYRRTANRKDFSLEPVASTLLDELEADAIPRMGVGKVDDLFAGRGISSTHTATNADAYRLIHEALGTLPAGLLLANVIRLIRAGDTGTMSPDPPGLRELTKPAALLGPCREDLIIFTADHGTTRRLPNRPFEGAGAAPVYGRESELPLSENGRPSPISGNGRRFSGVGALRPRVFLLRSGVLIGW
jgi:phosphopentomutase